MSAYFICTVQEIGGVSFTFPVNPETYSATAGRNYEEQQLIGSRDIPMVGFSKLEHLNFTAMLPGRFDAAYCNPGNFMLPVAAYSRLKTWATGAGGGKIRPLRVTIPGLVAETMFLVSANVSTQPAQEFGDVWVEVEFVKWIDPRDPPPVGGQLPPTLPNPYSPVPIPLYPVPTGSPNDPPYYPTPYYPPPAPPPWFPQNPNPPTPNNPIFQPAVITVATGDTLWALARHYYGAGTEWRRIWEANQPLTSGDPYELTPGETIRLPR